MNIRKDQLTYVIGILRTWLKYVGNLDMRKRFPQAVQNFEMVIPQIFFDVIMDNHGTHELAFSPIFTSRRCVIEFVLM